MFQPEQGARGSRAVRGRQPVPAAWRQQGTAGDRRWTERSAVGVDALFRLRWQKGLHIHIPNLSTDGCAIIGAGYIPVGTYSWVKLPTLESRFARVVWCDGSGAGVEFADPLHRSVADMIIARSPAAED
jgi:hypothetical protein